MAEDVLDKVLGDGHPQCNTLDILLHGGAGYSESLSIQLIQKYGLMEDVAEVGTKNIVGTRVTLFLSNRVWSLNFFCFSTSLVLMVGVRGKSLN